MLGLDWGRASAVERPDAAFDFGAAGTMPPAADAGTAGHPGHFPGQAIMSDVASKDDGGFAAVGYFYPGWRPIAWTSPDGSHWAISSMPGGDFTFPVALASGPGGLLVAVGRSGPLPAAWTSNDGTEWQASAVTLLGGDHVAERMTTVVAAPDGFVAGGSVGPELLDRHARFWRSQDGRAWQPIADDAASFDDAEVRSIVRFGGGYVAIGTTGPGSRATGSVAWISPDGLTWSRIDVPDLAIGLTVSLVEAPFGGLVAVGSDLDEHEASVWYSPDGRTWSLEPSEASRQYHGKMRMTDLAVAHDGFVAVGNFVGVQFGTAAAWTSQDAVHWTQSTEVPVMEQGEMYAVVRTERTAIAVGSFGAPDNYIPTVWISPAR